MAFILIHQVLHIIVGLTQPYCVAMAADVYEDFMDFDNFDNMQWDNIEKWIFTRRGKNINRGGLSV